MTMSKQKTTQSSSRASHPNKPDTLRKTGADTSEASPRAETCLSPLSAQPDTPRKPGTDTSAASPRAKTCLSLLSVPTKHANGFSLIELTTAIAVLMVGMLGVTSMYHFGADKMTALNESRIAVQAVQNEIESLRSLSFDKLRNGQDLSFVSTTPLTEKLPRAKSLVTIQDYEDPAKKIKKVTVSIKWTGENGRIITKSSTTLISDKT